MKKLLAGSISLLIIAFSSTNVSCMQENKIVIKGDKEAIIDYIKSNCLPRFINKYDDGIEINNLMKALKNPSQIFSKNVKPIGEIEIYPDEDYCIGRILPEFIVYSWIYQNRNNKKTLEELHQCFINLLKKYLNDENSKIKKQKEEIKKAKSILKDAKEEKIEIIKMLKIIQPKNPLVKKDFLERVDFLLSLE